MSQSYKQCNTCHQYKDASHFTINKNGKGGLQSSCRSCVNITTTNWKTEKRFEKYQEQDKVGCVYILANELHDGWYRIGQATSGMSNRLSVHRSSTPVPESIHFIKQFETKYSKHIEAVLISMLATHPETKDRRNDWFKIDRSLMLQLFDEVTHNEEASLRHRNEQPTQSHLALCN